MQDRRTFLSKTAAASALSTFAISKAQSANETFTLGIMGVGGRGTWLARAFSRLDHVNFAYVCDVNLERAEKSAYQIEEITGKAPKAVQDYRAMLDDPQVDAVINATPDHWHAPGTIFACQAGKHVYTEKPASHNLWEGRKMVEAARKYVRVVQLGTQTRSAPYAKHGIEFIESGDLGEVHLVKIFNVKTRGQLKPKPNEPAPSKLDYDAWLGPAPKRPYNPNHYYGGTWNWKWNYSGGDIINDGIHQIDLGRWASMRKSPKTVYSTGHTYVLMDDQDSPDTQNVIFEFDDLTMTIEVGLWMPYMKKTPQDIRASDVFPDWRFNSTRVEVYGTKGIMYFGRHGGGWQVFFEDWKGEPFEYGKDPIYDHIDNFFESIRSNTRPNADIEEGHLSTSLCHLANISYRTGSKKLHFDAVTETFDDEDANKLLKREYRSPYVIREDI